MKQIFLLGLGGLLWLYCPQASAQNTQVIDSLQQVLSADIADSSKVIVLGELSWEYHIHHKEKALQYARQELTLAEKINFPKGIGLGYLDQGVTYSYHQEYDKAIDLYQKALPHLEKAGKHTLIALTYYNIAVAYSKFEASEKAIANFLKAVDLLEKQQDWANVSQSYTGIANSYATLHQFPKAIDYHHKAVKVAREHTDYEMLAVALTDFSATFNTMFDTYHQPSYLDSSLVYLNQVHELLKAGKVKNPIMQPSVIFNMGNTYFQQENYEEALPLILQALVLAEPVNLQAAICQGNTILGKIYTRQKNYAAALPHFQKALPIALETNPLYAADTYEAMMAWAADQKKFQEAFDYQQQLVSLKDSIYHLGKTEMAERMGLQYETEKKEARIASLEQENHFERNRNILYLALLAMGLLLSGVIFYLLRLKQKVLSQKAALSEEAREKALLKQALAEKQRERLQKELYLQAELNQVQEIQFRNEMDFKERELTTNVLLLEQQSGFLQKIKTRLQTMLPQANRLEPDLKEVCKLIDNRLTSEQDFEKFMVHFEKVHPDFFSQLDKTAPATLTPADQKLSAYIRMNLSTKEMAHLLNVEPKSIQMARYRLKLKLNLPEETDLVNFIQQL
ncbi:tetratricopeptide repeat protein [Rhodocytophaga rosea]|uniref:Tetratricopeptide repeat protein n=1 Tax=Rhodocytophaga rosea TaxID=2704465 RepID=A0A6C0GCB1_9BACT|nr:tetratricopeptide repeat protein [Rhodocytophaga rosea]QHT65595.1 tetratricopeptide repeat protein [Rhodocytophaga rosea]